MFFISEFSFREFFLFAKKPDGNISDKKLFNDTSNSSQLI